LERSPIMSLQDFVALHRPALERDQVRHNLMLGLLEGFLGGEHTDLRLWTLGDAGACAIETSPRRPIILGELDDAQCRALAEQTAHLDYAGVVGDDPAAPAFAAHASEQGITFAEPMRQAIHALHDKPSYPGARGAARAATPDDFERFAAWTMAFLKEAVPHDLPPSRESLEKIIARGGYRFWVVDGEPVAMAGIVRRTRDTAAIAGVYTPPHLRGRGYAGSVTAAVVEAVFAEGRRAACLYTDLANPASNRCYAKIGFKPVCRSWHFPRGPITPP
jgi:RimJ/RimL family protein N-acetyltransferase